MQKGYIVSELYIKSVNYYEYYYRLVSVFFVLFIHIFDVLWRIRAVLRKNIFGCQLLTVTNVVCMNVSIHWLPKG